MSKSEFSQLFEVYKSTNYFINAKVDFFNGKIKYKYKPRIREFELYEDTDQIKHLHLLNEKINNEMLEYYKNNFNFF